MRPQGSRSPSPDLHDPSVGKKDPLRGTKFVLVTASHSLCCLNADRSVLPCWTLRGFWGVFPLCHEKPFNKQLILKLPLGSGHFGKLPRRNGSLPRALARCTGNTKGKHDFARETWAIEDISKEGGAASGTRHSEEIAQRTAYVGG